MTGPASRNSLAAWWGRRSAAGRLAWGGLAIVAIVLLVYTAAALGRKGLLYWSTWQGQRLNSQAWEAGFRERGIAVPPTGPRDGYWGARLGSHTVHPELGWVLPARRVDGLLDIDELGMQHYRTASADKRRLLILGASTAFGAYASAENTTYFWLLGDRLQAHGTPFDIDVFATGAWKSSQELKALQLYGIGQAPDAVLFLNGLNDVTNGSNAHVLFGEKTATLDGSEWQLLYHEHDYPERVAVYLQHMRAARDLALAAGIEVIFVLQPALFEKSPRSAIEQTLEQGSLGPLGTRDQLLNAYGDTRRTRGAGAHRPGVFHRRQPRLRWGPGDRVHRYLAFLGSRSPGPGRVAGARPASGRR